MAPFYCILRAIPDKNIGIILSFSAIMILFFLPWLDRSPVRSIRYKGRFSRVALGMLLSSFVLLGYLGMQEWTPIYQGLAQMATLLYFAYFLLMPLYTRLEKCSPVPTRVRSC